MSREEPAWHNEWTEGDYRWLMEYLPGQLIEWVDLRPGRGIQRLLRLKVCERSWRELVEECVEQDLLSSLLRRAHSMADEAGHPNFCAMRRRVAARVMAQGAALERERAGWQGDIQALEAALMAWAGHHGTPLAPRDPILLDQMEIVIVGLFSSGKSSLINAWLGRPGLLPTSNNVTTPCETRLQRALPGEEEGVVLHFATEQSLRWRLEKWARAELREDAERLIDVPWGEAAAPRRARAGSRWAGPRAQLLAQARGRGRRLR